jgi:hypothetical protein
VGGSWGERLHIPGQKYGPRFDLGYNDKVNDKSVLGPVSFSSKDSV